MAKPVYRVTISRKDGEDITFTNYKGEEVTKKYAPVGALFPRDKGEGFSFALDPAAEGLKLDSEKYWMNVYPCEDRPSDGGGRPRVKKPANGKKPKDDGDLDF